MKVNNIIALYAAIFLAIYALIVLYFVSLQTDESDNNKSIIQPCPTTKYNRQGLTITDLDSDYDDDDYIATNRKMRDRDFGYIDDNNSKKNYGQKSFRERKSVERSRQNGETYSLQLINNERDEYPNLKTNTKKNDNIDYIETTKKKKRGKSPLLCSGSEQNLRKKKEWEKRRREMKKNNNTAPIYYYPYDELRPDELLRSDFQPNVVYYFWCGSIDRTFEFAHFIGVKSALRLLRPDSFVFLCENQPALDYWKYHTWFIELSDKYPFFRTQWLGTDEFADLNGDKVKDMSPCIGNGLNEVNMEYVYTLLRARGGFYLSENVVLSRIPLEFRTRDFLDAYDPITKSGFIAAKKNGGFGELAANRINGVTNGNGVYRSSLSPSSSNNNNKANDGGRDFVEKVACVTENKYSTDDYNIKHRTNGSTNSNKLKPYCVRLDRIIFPKDFWDSTTAFAYLIRTIFYGDGNIKAPPTPSYETLIPNIAHLVWLGGGEMDFLFLLCVLSLLHVARVERLYIHGNGPPTGRYWELVKREPKLILIYRDFPGKVYGTPVKVISHVTDIWRVDFMIKYGGIYVDTDTVFVRPLTDKIRGYDAIASYDWTYWNHPFPDTINFGVSMGKRNAKYWHLFQESMKWFLDDDWAWNGLRQPYKIQERHPDLILVDPHLQVICFQSLCHPTWWPDYHNESIHHLNSHSIKDWKNDVFAFHWTLPTPFELLSPSNLFKTDTMFSHIAKYILEESNYVEKVRNLI